MCCRGRRAWVSLSLSKEEKSHHKKMLSGWNKIICMRLHWRRILEKPFVLWFWQGKQGWSLQRKYLRLRGKAWFGANWAQNKETVCQLCALAPTREANRWPLRNFLRLQGKLGANWANKERYNCKKRGTTKFKLW